MKSPPNLNARHLPGLRFTGQPFIPVVGLYGGQRCGGVAVRVTDKQAVRSMRMGIEIATILKKLYPSNFDPAKLLFLVGNADTIRQLQEGTPPEQIVASWSNQLNDFDTPPSQIFPLQVGVHERRMISAWHRFLWSCSSRARRFFSLSALC